MSRTLERCVACMIVVLVLGAMVAALSAFNHPETPEGSLVPRHDRPFDVLPPEHIKALEESRKAGR